MPVLSKAYYSEHDFLKTTLDAPLGSGSYKVKRAKPGSYIEYERVEDYWAADLPFARGLNNFDTLRIEFYRDRQGCIRSLQERQNYLSRRVHIEGLGHRI